MSAGVEKTKEVVYNPPKGVVDLQTVSNTLLEMMQEVKRNPAAIPQATAMCEIANRVCDIAKVQVAQGSMVLEMLRQKNNI